MQWGQITWLSKNVTFPHNFFITIVLSETYLTTTAKQEKQ